MCAFSEAEVVYTETFSTCAAGTSAIKDSGTVAGVEEAAAAFFCTKNVVLIYIFSHFAALIAIPLELGSSKGPIESVASGLRSPAATLAVISPLKPHLAIWESYQLQALGGYLHRPHGE